MRSAVVPTDRRSRVRLTFGTSVGRTASSRTAGEPTDQHPGKGGAGQERTGPLPSEPSDLVQEIGGLVLLEEL